MPYNLFITRADGHTFKALRSPYTRRADTERTIRMIVTAPLAATTSSDIEFASGVTTAPLGETVTHQPTGIAFRTEEI